MEEKFQKLEALLKENGKIDEIFCGTAEEILKKLEAYGIVLSMEELNDLKEGFNAEMRASDELTEESLDDVAGGCDTCKSDGYAQGVKIAKTLRKIKNFLCFWDW